jgi:membrane protein YqaA with SNARE-associated domain
LNFEKVNIIRRLYNWVLSLAETRYGSWALFCIAAAESSFFPVPPDVLLIALAVGAPKKAIRFASVCTAGSVIGASLGYLLGWEFYELVGRKIIALYSAEESYAAVKLLYQEWDAVAVMVAGFTPIPYKVFTIAAGAFQINFATFMLASLVSRGARFLLIGALIWWLGPSIKDFIDRYFNWLAILFVILLFGGFIAVKYVI